MNRYQVKQAVRERLREQYAEHRAERDLAAATPLINLILLVIAMLLFVGIAVGDGLYRMRDLSFRPGWGWFYHPFLEFVGEKLHIIVISKSSLAHDYGEPWEYPKIGGKLVVSSICVWVSAFITLVPVMFGYWSWRKGSSEIGAELALSSSVRLAFSVLGAFLLYLTFYISVAWVHSLFTPVT